MIDTSQQQAEMCPVDTNPETELKAALENAKYSALTCRARSDPAHSLVEHFLSLLPEATAKQARDTANPQRTRGAYAKTRPQWRRGVDGFLVDLLRAQNREKDRVCRSRDCRCLNARGRSHGPQWRMAPYVLERAEVHD
jgi:hypothetical protein